MYLSCSSIKDLDAWTGGIGQRLHPPNPTRTSRCCSSFMDTCVVRRLRVIGGLREAVSRRRLACKAARGVFVAKQPSFHDGSRRAEQVSSTRLVFY